MMRFNEKELTSLALSTSVRFDKEGCLYMYDREGKYLKRTEGFIERLFRLKGNILLYFRSTKRDSTPLGCFILETCKVEECLSVDKEFTFNLRFGGDETRPVCLAAISGEEYRSWISSIETASYAGLRNRVLSLRTELEDVRKSMKPVSLYPNSGDKNSDFGDIHGIEILIECSLATSSFNSPPSTYISLSILTANKHIFWLEHCQTEICEDSYEPFYLTSACLNFTEMSIKPSTELKFTLFIVQNRKEGTKNIGGFATCQMQEIIQALNQKIVFKIKPQDRPGLVGTINIVPKLHDGGSTPSLSTDEASIAPEMPVRFPDIRPIRPFKHDFLTKSCANLCAKNYRFPVADEVGDEVKCMRVKEMMGETKISFLVPQQLLNIYIAAEKLSIEEFSRLGAMQSNWETIRYKVIQEHVDLCTEYEESLQEIKKFTDPYFKPSKYKMEQKYQFIPTNLHIQGIAILDPFDDEHHYSVTTVGAAAAHSMKFKNGGLYKQLRQLSLRDSTKSQTEDHINEEYSARELKATTRTIYFRFTENLNKLKTLLKSAKSPEDIESTWNNVADSTRYLMNIYNNKIVQSLLTEYKNCQKVLQSTKDLLKNFDFTRKVIAQDNDWEWMEANLQYFTAMQPNSSQVNHYGPEDVLSSLSSKIYNFKPNQPLTDEKDSILQLEEQVKESVSHIIDTTTFARMKDENSKIESLKNIRRRRDIVFSQVVSALVASFYYKIMYENIYNPKYFDQIMTIGFLASFESLLSNYGDETGMLEDMWIGVRDCKNVSFKINRAKGDQPSPIPSISGSRTHLIVNIELEEKAFSELPEPLQTGRKLIKVVPVLFTVGINEQATIAERLGQVALQDAINDWSFKRFKAYFEQYMTMHPNTRTSKSSYSPSLSESLQKLEEIIQKKANKNIGILIQSEEICRRLDGGRLTCCKSGKDRTSMSVTLEQCLLLRNEHNLEKKYFERALETMRSEGPRRENTWKNANARCYAFNRMQVMVLPNLYKPPAGTYGSAQT